MQTPVASTETRGGRFTWLWGMPFLNTTAVPLFLPGWRSVDRFVLLINLQSDQRTTLPFVRSDSRKNDCLLRCLGDACDVTAACCVEILFQYCCVTSSRGLPAVVAMPAAWRANRCLEREITFVTPLLRTCIQSRGVLPSNTSQYILWHVNPLLDYATERCYVADRSTTRDRIHATQQ
jgi:hypothetical protein